MEQKRTENARARQRWMRQHDLDPIEPAFSKFKAHLRKGAERTIPRLLHRIGRVVRSFNQQECRNFFHHAGYVRT
jgi:hypothetical protein